jgi:fermentation-respiration switch protein FrsA (DUF1100 family)
VDAGKTEIAPVCAAGLSLYYPGMAWADHTFYFPTRRIYDDPREQGLVAEDVTIPSGDGVLAGWFFPAVGRARGTVLHCHGNAGNITAHFRFVDWLPAAGWNVLTFDYRGYGRSTGKVTRANTIDDVAAALAYTRSRPDVDPDRIVVLGQSLGGSTAIVALTRPDAPQVAGLCVDGSFSSYRVEAYHVCRLSRWLRPCAGFIRRFLISDHLSPRDVVGRLAPMPKLFVCGTADVIVPFTQTVELHDLATGPKELWVIEGADHNDAFTRVISGACERVLEFFNRCVPEPGEAGVTPPS